MKTWLIGDTHFMHTNIIKYCDRPIDCWMRIEQAWQDLVNPRDLVIHLGDVCMGASIEVEKWYDKVFRYLPGDKLLIKGNHDHRPYGYFRERGWQVVVESLVMKICKKKIVFSHEPLDMSEWLKCEVNVHAHMHNVWPRGQQVSPQHKLYCIEYEDYKPVDLEEFIAR